MQPRCCPATLRPAPTVQSPPTQVMCSTGIPKAGMLPGTRSWDHALSFPSKRGQPTNRGDERGPQDQEWGKKGNTGPRAVISADFQEEGEPKSQSANRNGCDKRSTQGERNARHLLTPLPTLPPRSPAVSSCREYLRCILSFFSFIFP